MLFAFGDVFRYQEEEFVYLAQLNQVTYAAKIFNKELTHELLRMSETAARMGKGADMPIYSFVVLTTLPFDGRAAHVGLADKNSVAIEYPEKICALSPVDLNAVKNEILDSKGVAIALRDYVKNLDRRVD